MTGAAEGRPAGGTAQVPGNLLPSAGPRCEHLRLLKLQGEPVNIREAYKAQKAVSDFLADLSQHGAQQHECSLPDLRSLRLIHPTNCHEHAKDLCECVLVNFAWFDRSWSHCSCPCCHAHTDVFVSLPFSQAGTSLAAAKPGEEENMVLEASRIDLESKWATASNVLQCIPQQLHPGKQTASTCWIQPPADSSVQVGGACEAHSGSEPAPVVIQVAVHTPDHGFHRSQAILLAAHHTLVDFRRAIHCVNDKYAAQQLGSVPASGYMLLNDTLYVDDSDETAEDYTRPILSFLEDMHNNAHHRIARYLQTKGLNGEVMRPNELPGVKSMQGVRMGDLQLTPGQHGRYMYGHCGACEHMLVVEDVRLKHAADPELTGLPVTVGTLAMPLHKCCICAARPSTKVAYGDRLAPSCPAFFCSGCFDDLHLGADGQPILLQPEMDVFDVEL
jgi:hypothetical protein